MWCGFENEIENSQMYFYTVFIFLVFFFVCDELINTFHFVVVRISRTCVLKIYKCMTRRAMFNIHCMHEVRVRITRILIISQLVYLQSVHTRRLVILFKVITMCVQFFIDKR